MSDLEADLRAAAFHGGDVSDRTFAAAGCGTPRERWLAAVVLGARGRYARALALLEPLTVCHDPVIASLASSALASHRRQLGAHVEARKWDAAALRVLAGPEATERDPDGIDMAGAVADAILGLAADAVGAGRIAEARRLVGRLESGVPFDVPLLTGWRARVRHGWVSAEVELAAGNAAAARAPACRAGQLARGYGAPRHAVKSDIVLAAALITSSQELDRAAALVKSALEAATALKLDSLIWPAAMLARSLGQAVDVQADVTSVLYRVLLRADAHGRGMAAESPWMPVAR